MEKKIIIKNISYTLFSNLLSFVTSAIITFIIPKILGVDNFGYFQLYLFYSSYTGFLHFGWADGILLRYGGSYYENLNKSKFSGQLYSFIFVEFLISVFIFLLAKNLNFDYDKMNIFAMLGILVTINLPRTMLQYILQGTNRIREYAYLIVIEKIVYIISILFTFIFGEKGYMSMIYSDLFGKFCAYLYAVYNCRDILVVKPEPMPNVFSEVRENIKVGSRLMLANISSFLIIGIVRISIESNWDIATFGKISLTLSVSNLLMVFIRAVSLVMFPLLKRLNSEKFVGIYKEIRVVLMIVLFGILLFYYPIKIILGFWLPTYEDGLMYMALLFPICIYESKMSILNETYMKALRMEKSLLYVNFITVILSLFLTIITVYYFENLVWAMLSITILLAFRCVFAEQIIAKELKMNLKKYAIYEIILTVLFVYFSWKIENLIGAILYLVVYSVYFCIMYINNKNIFLTIKMQVINSFRNIW